MRILLVDDERTALRDLERVVRHVRPEAEIKTADSAAEALDLCREEVLHVVFLDIQMPEMDGLTLAREMTAINPEINIVMVTGYSQYALDAMKLYVSDFIVKPARIEDVSKALEHLRHPVPEEEQGLRVQCFGDFEVFFGGRPIRFGRSKTKELMAFLVDRKGAAVNTDRICAVLWEEEQNDRIKNYFRQLVMDLRRTLQECGAEDVLNTSRNSFAIDSSRISCDYYRYLAGDPAALQAYQGEYMSQYDWAEFSAGRLASPEENSGE